MTRSSRHKSSKHSSRDVREYSDSEKDSSLKDRKGKEESGVVRVSKDSSSSEKRKLDLKDGKDSGGGSGNGDYSVDLVSTKRRKERLDDGGSDRWNGGDDDHRRSSEGSKKSLKASGESKSKKRDESVELYAEGGEVKKNSSSSGKGEGRHRDRDRDKESIRKEGKEGGGAEREKERDREKDRDREREREKKGKDGRTERLVSSDEQRVTAKQVNEKTDLNAWDELESPDSENQIERRMRKRRDDFGDGDKHQDDVEDINDGLLSYRDDSGRDSRHKDEKRKDERYKEKHREDVDKDNKHREDKQRDELPPKDYTSSKSDEKHLRDEKDLIEIQQKRSKIQDGERKVDHDRDRDRNRDRDSYHVRDRDRYHDREHGWDHGRDRDYDRDWDWDRERERDGDRERDRNHDRDRGRDRDRDGDRDRDRDYDRDYDGSHIDDRSTRYKDGSRGKKRSPDDRDDGSDKSRGMKARYSDLEKKSSSGDRVESDANKGRSQSRQAYVDTKLSVNKRRTSLVSNSHGGIDEYRYLNSEDLKYRDSGVEHRSKAMPPKDGSGPTGVSERGSKYRSMEKPNKMDDGHLGELSNDKSSSSKASPLPLMERSPSSSSIDRRYMNRTGVRRSLDIEETGRRSSASVDNRDFSNTEDRLGRDLPSEKPLADDSSPADSSANNRSNQSNLSSLYPPHPNFRVGVDSPFIGSMEEEGRGNSNARYRRSSDPNLVRGHGNAWRGVPSWNSPVPNGFMHFQHGAPHGGFQGMLPQFPAPPIYGVRPSMDINHSGMPYHMPDAERFSNHLRPLGWQNMMDGSGPSHLHLWDGSNGAFRDETHMYGGAEWDQSRHPMNARGWESGGETWKVHNNDVKGDLPSPAQKDDYLVQAAMDDAVAGKTGQMSLHEDNLDLGVSKTVERRSAVTSPLKEPMPKSSHEKSPGRSKFQSDDVLSLSHYYLSKLDISSELAHPEVYSQCMSILDSEQSATVDEDATTHTILEGVRAGLKSSRTLLSSSLFPPLKDFVFQKAMNLYKKQRMETVGLPIIAGGALDIILASDPENMESKDRCGVEKVEGVVLTSDAEMEDAPVLTSGVGMADAPLGTALGDGAENLEVPVSSPKHEVQNDKCVPSPILEMAAGDNGGSKAGDPQTIPNGVEIESSEQVKLEVGDANGFSSPGIESLATTTLPAAANDNVISKTEDDNPIDQASTEGTADAVTGPLIIPEGSQKACEALMPGSNESDSVILSRIHHSPESTH